MTYIEHMNQLWRSALLSPMPASEIALFAYLVNESNKRYWKMPFACSTTRICENCQLTNLQLFQIILILPFMAVPGFSHYAGSSISKLFGGKKDLLYSFMAKDNID